MPTATASPTATKQRWYILRDVPVFAEHVTKARNGRTLIFNRENLQRLAESCNRRIQQTGDYAAVTIGHTPDRDALAAGATPPKVVGFAGPFRVGRLGEGEDAKWCIFADLRIFPEFRGLLKHYPRRSAELWLVGDYDQMYLDPIALLGAETPRLDLGLVYSADRAGVVVEKYAAAHPSATSTCLPAPIAAKAGSSPPSKREAYAMATKTIASGLDVDEIVQAVLQALDGLDWVQAAKQKAQDDRAVKIEPESQKDASGTPAPEDAAAGTAEEEPEPAEEETADVEASAGQEAPPAGPDAAGRRASPPADDEEDKDKDKDKSESYAAEDAAPAEAVAELPANDPVAKLRAALEAAMAPLIRRLEIVESQLRGEGAKVRDLERYARIEALRREGYLIDTEATFQRLRYERCPSDKEFERSLELLRSQAVRAPADLPMPPTAPRGGATAVANVSEAVARATEQQARQARELCMEARKRGLTPDFHSTLAAVVAGRPEVRLK
jgi:hypothetical protein